MGWSKQKSPVIADDFSVLQNDKSCRETSPYTNPLFVTNCYVTDIDVLHAIDKLILDSELNY